MGKFGAGIGAIVTGAFSLVASAVATVRKRRR